MSHHSSGLQSVAAGGRIAGVASGAGAGGHVIHNLMTRTRHTWDTSSLRTHPAVGVVSAGPNAGISAVVVVARSTVAAVAVQVTLAVVSAESAVAGEEHDHDLPVVVVVGAVVVVVVVRLRSGTGQGRGHQAAQEGQQGHGGHGGDDGEDDRESSSRRLTPTSEM